MTYEHKLRRGLLEGRGVPGRGEGSGGKIGRTVITYSIKYT